MTRAQILLGLITLLVTLGLALDNSLWPGLAQAKPPKPTPFSPKTGFVKVPLLHGKKTSGSVQLYYELYNGEKTKLKPLLFLHGGPGGAVRIQPILASPLGHVLLRRYRILYLHQRGAGKSKLPLSKRTIKQHIRWLHLEQYVQDLDYLRKAVFGPKARITIIGSSWGGFLGLAYTHRFQALVERAILGSFEATATSGTTFCTAFDDALLKLQQAEPAFKPVLTALMRALAKGLVVWRRGKPEQVVLAPHHLVDLVAPFLAKAKYDMAKRFIGGLLKRDPRSLQLLDRVLYFRPGLAVSFGHGLAGEATYCAELIDYTLLRHKQRHPAPTLYCDDQKIAHAIETLCRAYTPPTRGYNFESRLSQITTPALLIAGKKDPIIPWLATARTAHKMRNATFLLVQHGGHTPFRAGGRCLAAIIDRFAQGKTPLDLSCLRTGKP